MVLRISEVERAAVRIRLNLDRSLTLDHGLFERDLSYGRDREHTIRACLVHDTQQLDLACAAGRCERREFEIEIKVRRKELNRRKQDLERESEAFETDTETRRRRLERQVEKAREAFDRAKNG